MKRFRVEQNIPHIFYKPFEKFSTNSYEKHVNNIWSFVKQKKFDTSVSSIDVENYFTLIDYSIDYADKKIN